MEDPAGRTLDALDVDILRHTLYVATDPAHAERGLLGPWQIASRLGLHGTTVKSRLAALRASGILQGVVLVPHLSLLRTRLFHYRLGFESPAGKDEGLALAAATPEIHSVRDFVGHDAWIGLFAPDEHEAARKATTLARACGATADLLYEAQPPPIRFAPRDVDLRILRALAADAHLDVEAVAREADASSRTVRRRLGRLEEARAFSVFPNVDLGRVNGAVTVTLEISLANGAAGTAAFNAIPEWAHREIARDDLLLISLSTPDLAAVQEACRRASALPGVLAARPRFLLRAQIRPDAIRAALDAARQPDLTRGAS